MAISNVLSKIWDVLFIPTLAVGTPLYFLLGDIVVVAFYEKIGFIPFFMTSYEEGEFLKALSSHTLTVMLPLAAFALVVAVGLLFIAIMRSPEIEKVL